MTPDQRSFLGTGWSFPPLFSAGGAEVQMVSGEEDILQSLRILLATALGERVMQEDFGSRLNDYLFEELDQRLLDDLRGVIMNAIIYHETRIEPEEVSFDLDGDPAQATVFIRIHFRVRLTNSRYNMVYPFYLREAKVSAGGTTQ